MQRKAATALTLLLIALASSAIAVERTVLMENITNGY